MVHLLLLWPRLAAVQQMSDCTRTVWREMVPGAVSRMPMHCGHPDGSISTKALADGETIDPTTGVEVMKCCHCGEVIQVSWSIEELPIDGHGPKVVEPRKVWHWPMGWES